MTDNNKSIPALVTPDWLAKKLTNEDLCIIDASWYLPTENRNPHAEFHSEHIPGARFFDVDAVSDQTNELPHMVPSECEFSSAMTKLGVTNDMKIVIYDGHGLMSAARVWWTFRTFGHHQVSVLNGGLPAWKSQGHETLSHSAGDSSHQTTVQQTFKARLDIKLIRSLEQMKSNLDSPLEQVVDARPPARFNGTAPEPRQGLRRGHIPGSCNVPFVELLDPATYKMLSPEQITTRFIQAGIDLECPIIATCGSGITASVLALALYTIGRTSVAVYDGSWAEWGEPGDNPVATGLISSSSNISRLDSYI